MVFNHVAVHVVCNGHSAQALCNIHWLIFVGTVLTAQFCKLLTSREPCLFAVEKDRHLELSG